MRAGKLCLRLYTKMVLESNLNARSAIPEKSAFALHHRPSAHVYHRHTATAHFILAAADAGNTMKITHFMQACA